MSTPASPFSTVEPWDLVAEGYAAEAGTVMEAFSRKAIEITDPAPDARVIDVAAGPGTLVLDVARRVRDVVAVDFSPRMIEALQAKVRAAGLENVRAVVGDGQRLDVPSEQFDVAYSMFGLMFFPDRPKGYAELLRVLRPGGAAVVSSWAPVQDSPLMSHMFGALRAADPTFPEPLRNLESLENPDVLAAELRAAGFVDVEIIGHTHTVEVGSAGELWHRMTRSSAPLVMLRHRVGEDEWARRAEVAQRHLEDRMARESPVLSTTAWLGIGRKPA
jgi:SAM-dependent methyltransferase